MESEQWSRRRVLAAMGVAAAGSVAGCSFSQSTGTPTGESPSGSDPSGEDGSGTPSNPDYETVDEQIDSVGSPFTEVYREVADSVVAVRVNTLSSSSQGTAWVYDANHVVTNEHVVSDADAASVWFDEDGWRSAEVVGTDVYSDLAVLDVSNRPDDATSLNLVENEPPIGTRVMAIGNPFGLSGSLTTGVVSGRNRTLPAPNGFSIPDAVQTDAAVNPGNSGGPLVNLDGKVVGVINSGGGDNIGFGISAALTSRVVPALISQGEYDHSYMGIGLTEVTPALVEANDLPVRRGVYVQQVVDGGPAEGVLQGATDSTYIDGNSVPVGGDTIVRMGDTPIVTQRSLSTFLALQTSPGDTITVEVIRDGRRTQLPLTLGERPPP
jgi:serine protease Do